MNIKQAHETGIKTLKDNPEATSVVVEFISETTGLTKFLKVTRDDQLEVMNHYQAA